MKVNLDEKFFKDVENKVKVLEGKTSSELVPAILKSGDTYPAARFRLALVLTLTIPYLGYTFTPLYEMQHFMWIQFASFLTGWVLGNTDLSRRLLTSKAEQLEESHQRALEIFVNSGVTNTENRSGVLICLFLLERRIEVIADSGIFSKAPDHFWDEEVESFRQNVGKLGVGEAFLALVDDIGAVMEEHFPYADGKNELSNKLITD